jgi:hypothetical protein
MRMEYLKCLKYFKFIKWVLPDRVFSTKPVRVRSHTYGTDRV